MLILTTAFMIFSQAASAENVSARTVSDALQRVFVLATTTVSDPVEEECRSAVEVFENADPGVWVINYGLNGHLREIATLLGPMCGRLHSPIEKYGLRYLLMRALGGQTADGKTLASALDAEVGTNWERRLDSFRE